MNNGMKLWRKVHSDKKKRGLAKGAYIGISIVVILAGIVGVLFGLHLINSQPQVHYLTAHTDYLFMKPENNGEYDVGYYNSQGQWVNLGTYNVHSNALNTSVNILNSYNQQNDGTILSQYGTQFQPLDYVVVVGNTTGTVQLPVEGNTIL